MAEKIVLASASPRRRELLKQMGLEFTVHPAKGEEVITKQKPDEIVTELAKQKAMEVAAFLSGNAVVIGADTVVAKDGKILGKPKDEENAFEMLSLLEGETHQVYTGVCLLQKQKNDIQIHAFYEATEVEFYPMSEQEIRGYIAGGEPMDKAGAYGIQGKCAVYIRGIRGDYNNVVGLPISRLYHEMCKIGCMPQK